MGNEEPHAGAYLGSLTWPEAQRALATHLVIVPFAAGAKQHGPHLPMNADQVTMEYLLDAAVETKNVLVCPPVLHGWFPAFRSYPGTEIADAGTFQAYVSAVAESVIAHGAQRLVFLNMGVSGATGLPIGIVARDLRANRRVHTLVVSWDDLETAETERYYGQLRGGHADEGETSIMLFLRADAVRMEHAAPAYRTEPTPQIGHRPGVFDKATESGTYGDPTQASADKGKAILEIMRRNWLVALDQFDAATSDAR